MKGRIEKISLVSAAIIFIVGLILIFSSVSLLGWLGTLGSGYILYNKTNEKS